MRDSQDADVILDGDVREMVWKSRHRNPPDIETRRDRRHRHARSRPLSHKSECGRDRIDERLTEARPMFVVPGRRGVELRCGLRGEPDRQAHRVSLLRNRSCSIGHGSPASSPDRARRARCSSSSAQAAWTESASSTAGSSRLARSSAATVARARAGRVSASRRIASESIDITTSVMVTADEHRASGIVPVQPPPSALDPAVPGAPVRRWRTWTAAGEPHRDDGMTERCLALAGQVGGRLRSQPAHGEPNGWSHSEQGGVLTRR